MSEKQVSTADLEGDAPETQALTNEKMRELTELSNELKGQREKIIDIEDKLKKARIAERDLSEGKIPQLMTEIGVERIDLKDGGSVIIKEDLKININNGNRTRVMDFIRKEGDSAIIKNEVSVIFGKGEEEEADRCFMNLDKSHENVSRGSTVNTGTFKSMVKELIENGVNVPFKELGIFNYRMTVIK